jgi:hypothetical protein
VQMTVATGAEPLGSLRGAWREVPGSTWVVLRRGDEELHAFGPIVHGQRSSTMAGSRPGPR